MKAFHDFWMVGFCSSGDFVVVVHILYSNDVKHFSIYKILWWTTLSMHSAFAVHLFVSGIFADAAITQHGFFLSSYHHKRNTDLGSILYDGSTFNSLGISTHQIERHLNSHDLGPTFLFISEILCWILHFIHTYSIFCFFFGFVLCEVCIFELYISFGQYLFAACALNFCSFCVALSFSHSIISSLVRLFIGLISHNSKH